MMKIFRNKILYLFFLFSFLASQDIILLKDWSFTEINSANTALHEDYLTFEEKNVFLFLNLARINPRLFSNTILKNYKGINGLPNDFLKNDKLELRT